MEAKNKVELSWHPNFRDASRLPDIKPVTSAFFINFGTLIVCLILLGYWGFVEMQIGTLGRLIADDAREISFRSKDNEKLLAQSNEFEKSAKNINEIQGFLDVPFKPSSFLTQLGEAKPAEMTMTELSYTTESRLMPQSKEDKEKKKKPVSYVVYGVAIKGSIVGTSRQGTTAVEKFRDQVEALPIFKDMKFEQKPTLKAFERDRTMDLQSFTIVMEVKR